ncbi:MAG: respiratory nitrate reductase subunit gamma [Candidatus Dormibacterales bacterium]
MNTSQYLWLVSPYVAIAVFVVGHVWRYRQDKFGWTTRSTQLLESRWLAFGSNLFHYGALAAIAGHVLGILIPSGWTDLVGLGEARYHLLSTAAGAVAGVACGAGLVILVARRLRFPRVRVTTSYTDMAVYLLLIVLIGLGLFQTIGVNGFGSGYDYRATVSIWFRGVFSLNPQPGLMAAAPLPYQVHAALAWLLFALWPFSRLVHAWSVPFQYLGRPYILYRSRFAVAGRR